MTEILPPNNPELEVDILDSVSDPVGRWKELALSNGMNVHVVERMAEKLRARHQGAVTELKAVKTGDLVNVIEDRMWHLLEFMDDEAMAVATVKDLAIAFGILGDKRQLLRGEPTHIISHTERLNLNDLVPKLIEEAKRRGVELFTDADYTDITHGDPRKVSPGTTLPEKNAHKKVARKVESGEP